MDVKVREWKGAWWIFVDHKGRRKAKRVGIGKEAKRAAFTAKEKIQAKLALGETSWLEETSQPAPVPTVRELGDQWLRQDVPLRCKDSTGAAYRLSLETRWFPFFGDRPVTGVTREEVKAAVAQLGKTLRRSTLKYAVLPPLQGLFAYAVERGLVAASPVARFGKYVTSDVAPQERLDPFLREELVAILNVAERDFPEWHPAILTAARAGLRFGEWTALRPDDLDFRGGAILIRRAAYLGHVSTTKGGKVRRVDMSRQLARVLQEYLSVREAEAVVAGLTPSLWLFPGLRGGLVTRDHFTQCVWRPILRRAGVRYRPPHQLRHT